MVSSLDNPLHHLPPSSPQSTSVGDGDGDGDGDDDGDGNIVPERYRT